MAEETKACPEEETEKKTGPEEKAENPKTEEKEDKKKKREKAEKVPKADYDRLQAEFESHKQQYLRVLAEYDNFRKRSQNEKKRRLQQRDFRRGQRDPAGGRQHRPRARAGERFGGRICAAASR